MKCGKAPLEGEGHVTLYERWPMRLSIQNGPIETVEYICVNIRCMLVAPAKILEREGSISPSSFYGELLIISHTFYSPIYPLDEGNEDVESV